MITRYFSVPESPAASIQPLGRKYTSHHPVIPETPEMEIQGTEQPEQQTSWNDGTYRTSSHPNQLSEDPANWMNTVDDQIIRELVEDIKPVYEHDG